MDSLDSATLASYLFEARDRTLELVADLGEREFAVPHLEIVNPFLWELGHMAWFQEKWVLRDLHGREPIRPDADLLYDSSAVAHDTRWNLPLPSRAETLSFLEAVCERVVETVPSGELDPRQAYFYLLALYHQDMHTEAFTYMRQTLGYPAPQMGNPLLEAGDEKLAGSCQGDAEVPGGEFWLGASRHLFFVFDNEKWAHPVRLEPFRIARTPVTNREFAEFVDDGGYEHRGWWSDAGWEWRRQAGARHPVYWQREELGGKWQRRHFDRMVPLQPDHPVIHVCWHEAEAYCRWAGRRLPSEAEWEMAACWQGEYAVPTGAEKPFFPWGAGEADPTRTNLDWSRMDCVEVWALSPGDSPVGCRQMIGNVWEWTSSIFGPYPGFAPDPYQDYSQPWFGTRKVLRGGAWATRSRMVRSIWRNFFTPDRRDVFAGFRTCALHS